MLSDEGFEVRVDADGVAVRHRATGETRQASCAPSEVEATATRLRRTIRNSVLSSGRMVSKASSKRCIWQCGHIESHRSSRVTRLG